MKKLNSITYFNNHPIIIGLFTVLLTVMFGMSLAFASGLVTPAQVYAQVIGPPCCVVVPPVVIPPVVVPPVVIPPVIIPPVVIPPPVPACTLSASPTSFASDFRGWSTLSWTTTAATTATLNQGIGDVSPIDSGSKSIFIPKTTDFVLTVSGPGGQTTCSAKVTVAESPAVIYGCMDSSATNYNPAATSQTGAICIYPPAPVYGCMNPAATNYDSKATSSKGAVCIFPPSHHSETLCALTANPTTIQVGGSSTLVGSTTNAVRFSIDNGIGDVVPTASMTKSVSPTVTTTYTGTALSAGGAPVVCSATVTVTAVPAPPSGGGGGGGGSTSGGGGGVVPKITLSKLSSQPLVYLSLSQIPYTGLDLGPVGTTIYWIALFIFALAFAYLILFGVAPFVNRSLRIFGSRVSTVLNTPKLIPAGISVAPNISSMTIPSIEQELPEAPRSYSSYDGFKSFTNNGALSIEDIVKGLSREHLGMLDEHSPQSTLNVNPLFENVEPIYENVEPIVDTPVIETNCVPASVRGFVVALLEGDRTAVFAGLRQQIRGEGTSEHLISAAVFLLDDVYRARIDGTTCDDGIARMAAHLSTPMLEKLVAALTTALDSSYSSGVTGAKLALTRALAALGA